MNQVAINELYASNKKLNQNFNIFKKEHNENIETLKNKINDLENTIQKLNDNLIMVLNIESTELNSIKTKINENINS